MKIIGNTQHPREYICVIHHSELEKFLGLYYDKMKQLSVGDDVDLAKGHDHAREIADAMRTTQELIKAHQPVVTAILNGLRIQAMIDANPPQPQQT